MNGGHRFIDEQTASWLEPNRHHSHRQGQDKEEAAGRLVACVLLFGSCARGHVSMKLFLGRARVSPRAALGPRLAISLQF